MISVVIKGLLNPDSILISILGTTRTSLSHPDMESMFESPLGIKSDCFLH